MPESSKGFLEPDCTIVHVLKLLDRNNVNSLCNYDPRKLLDMGFTRSVVFEVGLRNYSDCYRSNNR